MKKLTLQHGLFVFIGLISLSSCLKDNDYAPGYDTPANAGVMYFVNNYADAPQGLLYYVDEQRIGNPYTGAPMVLDYRTFSGAQLLWAGKRKLNITNTDNEILLDTTLNIQAEQGYSSFIYGDKTHPLFALTQDKVIDSLRQDQSGIRFLNFAKGVETVNLRIAGEDHDLYSERSVETANSITKHQIFQAQDNGLYTFIISDATGNELARREYKNEYGNGLSGGYYTIMLVGEADNSDNPLYIGVVEHR